MGTLADRIRSFFKDLASAMQSVTWLLPFRFVESCRTIGDALDNRDSGTNQAKEEGKPAA